METEDPRCARREEINQWSGLIRIFPMFYAVEIADQSHGSFAAEYMQGCEQIFSSKPEAEAYVATFEDWEQPLLCIRTKVR